jgi:aminoglycoside N3'-acetyltransferase
MYRAYQQDGKLLMLGVDYQSSTYIHLVEVIYWNQRLGANPDAPYVALDRLSLGQFWDESGKLTRGRVGNANCRFFNIRNYVDSLLEEVKSNPSPYV